MTMITTSSSIGMELGGLKKGCIMRSEFWVKEFDILFFSITPPNLGQLLKPGTDLESAGPDVFKIPPTCPIWPSFGWDIWG